MQGDRRAGPAAHAPYADACGIWPGRRRCSGTAARAASRSRSPGRSNRPDEMAQPMAPLVARLAADPAMPRAFAKAFPGDAKRQTTTISPRRSRPTSAPSCRRRPASTAGSPARRRRCRAARSRASGCSPARPAAPIATAASPSPTTPSTTSACRATIAAAAPCCGSRPPSTRSRHRRCARSAARAPYMHDGSLATLDDVVRHYDERHRRAADAVDGSDAQPRR